MSLPEATRAEPYSFIYAFNQHLSEAPFISNDLSDIVSKFFTLNYRDVDDSPDLKWTAGRVRDLRILQQRTSEAHEHKIRDRLVALLAAAFHASIIAGAILGIYFLCYSNMMNTHAIFTGASVLAIGLGAIGVHLFLTKYILCKWRKTDDTEIFWVTDYHPILFFPPVTTAIPLVMGLNREGRYRRAIEEKKEGLIEEWVKVREFFESKKYTKLQELMTLQKQKHEEIIDHEKKLEIRSKGHTNAKVKIEKTQADLEKAKSYFSDQKQFWQSGTTWEIFD